MLFTSSVSHTESPEKSLQECLPAPWRLDKTGRLMLTRQTIRALQQWTGAPQTGWQVLADHSLPVKVAEALGPVTTLRVRYVSLLMSALTGDWKSMKVLRQGLPDKGLVQRIYDLDPFGFTYRTDLYQILLAIGRLPGTGW